MKVQDSLGIRGLLIPREGLIDMVGPGKHYSPFHETINIVLSFDLAEGISMWIRSFHTGCRH